MSASIIKIKGVSKRYRLSAAGPHYSSLRETIVQAARRLVGLEKVESPAAQEILWALKEVSFDVQPGEIVGLVGKNGAGKSTLLKLLSRITRPTSGLIELYGRTGSLLEVGTGFHPELTGRQNIFMNGAFLGMRKPEVLKHFDEIVAFSEVGRFIDTPVKYYSSGMYTRLAFAVAAFLDSDILLIDEILAVGDAFFQQRCLNRIREFGKSGRTIIFVSHNTEAITSLCTRAVHLESGNIVADGLPREVVQQYLKSASNESPRPVWEGDIGDEDIRLKSVRAESEAGDCFLTDVPIKIRIDAEVLRPIFGFVMALEVWSNKENLLACSGYDDIEVTPPVEINPGKFSWELVIPPHTFASGTYSLKLNISIANRKVIIHGPEGLTFTIQNISGIGRRFSSPYTDIFRPAWQWRRLNAA